MRRARTRGLEIGGGVLLALLLSLFVLVFRINSVGRTAMVASDSAFHRGDLPEAVRHAEAALLAYVPGSSHVGEAEARLVAVARGAEAERNFSLARSAWEALRVGYLRTRYPGKPTPKFLDEADRAIVRLDEKLRQR